MPLSPLAMAFSISVIWPCSSPSLAPAPMLSETPRQRRLAPFCTTKRVGRVLGDQGDRDLVAAAAAAAA